jgi:hypothetical protein
MKNKHIILLLLLLIGISLALVSSANAFSETFPLVESASVSRIVNANIGDRIVGDYTVSNIPTWIETYTGNPKTVQYEFKIAKVEGTYNSPQDITVFEVAQTAHSSFDIICPYTGNYILRFNVGSGNPSVTGIGNARATLNYQVVKPTPIPTPHSEPISLNLSSIQPQVWIYIGITAGIISIIILVIYSMRKPKKGLD